MDTLIGIANSITPYLKFTGETSEGGKPIPVLDTMIWYGEPNPTGYWYEGAKKPSGEAPGMEAKLKGKRIIGRAQKVIMYQFYRKPMATRLGILRRSALAENVKVATACAEFRRRWRNSSPETPKEIMTEISKTYADELNGMGYRVEWVAKIIEKALTGYENVL